jgi:uncharacterized protein (DUF2062 family)
MPKKFLQRYMPDHHKIRGHKRLQFLGELLHHQHLWHLNRRSVAGAFSVGLFVAFVPVPFQMPLAAILAILFHTNLPISVALVWVSNPITMPPLFYFAYRLGTGVLGIVPQHFTFELSFNWLMTSLDEVWKPFLLGCLILATGCALLGNILMRLIWRVHVVRNWELRKSRRRKDA